MRETFENLTPESPIDAARRNARPPLRRRFYAKAGTAVLDRGHALHLDEKPVRTPARSVLAAPTLPLARLLAAEWEAQGDYIDPARMPLTRLANAIIDGVVTRPSPVVAEVQKYLASDLMCYRAASPAELVARQQQLWDPVLDWAEQTLGARFARTAGITHIEQTGEALRAASAAIPQDAWRLGAVHSATTLTGSALLALAMERARLSADQAWQAANVDEDWNMEQWGRDEIALERRASRFAELQAAATVLAHSRD
jgi:chaperone required for assembly of F1-ATPase